MSEKQIAIFGKWNLSEIVNHIESNGGLTIETYTGNQPEHGYIVNDNLHRIVIPEDEFFSKGVHLLQVFSEMIKNQVQHIGIWHDTANRTVILDTVNIVHLKQEALLIGNLRNQRYIWDVDNQNEVTV